MNSGLQNEGARIAFGATTRRFLLRRRGLACVLSVQLIIAGGIMDLARAEDPPSPQMVSACRQTFGRAAFEGQVPIIQQPAMNKGGAFIRAANIHLIAGDYARAIEQFDHAINLNPANPHFYMSRGMARVRNREFDHAVEDFNQAIRLNPSSSMPSTTGERLTAV
jgi:tetratricopeptide (TPR) repeat protein